MTRPYTRRNLLVAGGLVAAGAGTAGLVARSAGAATHLPAAGAVSPWDQVPVILRRIVPPTFPDRNFDVTAFGAKGDGRTDDSAAFTKAIAACSKAGGGHVVVPAGKSFLTGPVPLLSNVDRTVLGTVKLRTATTK